jgi:hypothetical protein
MNYKKVVIFLILFNLLIDIVNGQSITQIIKGKIIDKETQSPLPGASIVILDTNPFLGAASDVNGNFVIKNVPIGRYNVKVSFISYEELIINEVLIGSGKEVVLNVELKENVIDFKEVVIKARKGEPLNSMATVSARQFSVEEANRYAGGFDDPAHLASSFAGVSSNLGNNGIVIRGNAPKGLLWRMEGVDISNPSHFANISSLGAGAITALSSQVMANSDFYTGAFPSEYGNALSGVFDIKLRTGNNEKREYTFQGGIVGIDVSSEGPFSKGKKASYLFNYRYSTFALLSPILPPEMGKLKYQDLSFKLNFPTPKAGTFSVWGIGALDYQGRDAKIDSLLWETDVDKQQYGTSLFMGAFGVNDKLIIGRKTYTSTTLAITGNGLSLNQKEYSNYMNLMPTNKIDNYTWKYTLTSFINHKFSAKHTNKTGITIDRLQYNLNIQKAESNHNFLTTYANEKGSSYLIQAYSQSRYDITEDVVLNVSVHSQFFALNNYYTIEPRTGLSWNFTPHQTLCISYGLHSQLEMLNFYLVQQQTSSGIVEPNKKLDFSKAHHIVISYEIKLTEYNRLKIEPYFQKLFNIPVIPDSYYSLLNLENGIYFNDSLVNKGTGRNIGVDITFERFLNKGYYYLVTASLFDSKYRGGDGIERNTRFNKNYVVNLLGGKEWNIGKSKNNIININAKLCLMGGDYMNPIDINATYAARDIVEDVSKAFTQRKSEARILSFSITYRKNKPKHASIWAFNFINVLGYKEFNAYYFDKTTNAIKKDINQLVIPNLSYKIEF